MIIDTKGIDALGAAEKKLDQTVSVGTDAMMTNNSQKLADLKRRVDEALDGKPDLSVKTKRLAEHINFFDRIRTLRDAARILSRLIEKMPPPIDASPYYGDEWQGKRAGHNAVRQTIIDIILEGE